MAHRYKGGSNNNRGTPLGFHKEGWNATLRVGMPHTYERASPELKSPLVVGGYSVDCNRKILHDRSKLQFIDETFLSEETIDVQLDLKKGMEKAIFYKGNSQESFENLLLWVLKNQDSLMSERSSQRLSADILCMRGTLKKICRSPYSSKSPWSILVAEFKGTYYIIPSTSKEGAGPKETTDTKQLWGNKFEQYLKGDSDDILDPNEEYRSVLKLTVGDFSLLYSPEIDCADPDVYQEDHKDMSAFVLIKMCKDATIESQDYYKKFRLSDWWLDNKLTGIPRIVVGSCTDSGIIHSIELMKTEDLPALGKNEWDPNVYINFLGRGGYGYRGGHQHYYNKESNDVFPVKRPIAYSGAAPQLKTPSVIGNYSVDGDREFGYDRSMLQFLRRKYLPETTMNVHLDLNKGIEDAVEYKGHSQESFENFLQWVFNNQESLMPDKASPRLSTNILCLRGTLKKIMKTPYVRESWTILVTEFKGSLYMVNWKPEDVAGEKSEIPKNVGFWGHKFEQYMKADPEDPLDANEEYRTVLKMDLGDFSLLYSPEVDCADPEEFQEDYQDLTAFVTVKSCKEVIGDHKMRNHRKYKLCDWWIENQLSGIPRIIVGYRNDDGIVHTLELLKTEDLPEQGQNEWEPNVCINFLVRFLDFMKRKVQENPSVVHKFERNRNGNIECTKMSGSSRLTLLPSWYTDKLFKTEEDSDEE